MLLCSGTPDNIVTFFGYVAEEVRQILAELGYASLDEIIGRPGLLQPRADLRLKKTKQIDTSYVLNSLTCQPVTGENFCPTDALDRSFLRHGPVHSNGFTFDDKILADTDVKKAIDEQKSATKTYKITNTDRASFSRVSGAVAKKYGDKGFQGRLRFELTGAAGQSFCAFLGQGKEGALLL